MRPADTFTPSAYDTAVCGQPVAVLFLPLDLVAQVSKHQLSVLLKHSTVTTLDNREGSAPNVVHLSVCMQKLMGKLFTNLD